MLLALHNIFLYIFCTFQKTLFLPNSITSVWKCFLQAFSVKNLPDTFSLEKLTCATREVATKGKSENNPKPPSALQSSPAAALLGPADGLAPCRVSCPWPGCPAPHPRTFCTATPPMALPRQRSLLLWLCHRLLQLHPSQLELLCCPTGALRLMSLA